MDIREELQQKIRFYEEQAKAYRKALSALDALEIANSATDTPGTRFVGARPLDAIREVLGERGEKIPKAELKRIVMEGGLAIGKKRPDHNFASSLEINIKTGNLTCEGKDELIGLGEWAKK